MSLYILDTDHITLYQNGNLNVGTRFDAKPPQQTSVTIISFEEQIRGRLAVVRRANTSQKQLYAYQLLEQTLKYFTRANVLSFTEATAEQLEQLRQQKIRIGTQDLKIASIALAHNGIVVTRNRRDFEHVPDLMIEDWSVDLSLGQDEPLG